MFCSRQLVPIFALLAVFNVQSADTSNSPLRIEDTSVNARSDVPLVLYTVVSQSPKDLFGYVLRAEFFNKGGQPVGTLTRDVVMAPRPDGSRLRQGERRDERIGGVPPKGTDGAFLSYRLTIDSVTFADGTTWDQMRPNIR